jgi:rod shape-determining protein MreC
MKKFYKILLVILFVICFFFLLNDRLFFKNNPLREIYKIIVIPVNKIGMEFNDIRSYKSISDDNNRLEKDNILLNSLKQENSVLTLENEKLKDLMGLEKSYSNKYVYARVISRNRLYFFDTFIISRGSGSGIAINDAVVSADGLIGRVVSVSKDYSTVRMITSNYDDNKLSVVVNGYNGNINKYSDGYLLIDGISNYDNISVGDKVYTSGLGVLDKGLFIGNVSKVLEDSYGISGILYVGIASLEDISYVMVLVHD